MGMIVTNKLYRKDFNQYSEEDWKYIFSIYKLRDKYNFTQEEFLASELVDKVDMMKKMDESLYKGGSFTIDEDKKPLVDLCYENSCESINNFLDNEEIKDDSTIVTDHTCFEYDPEIKQFLDGDKDNSFSEFRKIQSEYYDKIYSCQNRIEEYKKKIRAEIYDVKVYRQEIDKAFNEYIK